MTDIAAIRTRVNGATAGRWARHGSDVFSEYDAHMLFTGRDGTAAVRHQADQDAEFVAHARADVLALLALLDQTAD